MKTNTCFLKINGTEYTIKEIGRVTGIHIITIYQHIRGLRNPTRKLIDRYLDGLGITYDEFRESLDQCRAASRNG